MERTLEIFAEAVQTIADAGIDFGVFGGVAVWGYGGRRPTKDIDLLLHPSQADSALEALAAAGFATERTNPRWLFKASKDGVEVDLIFEVAGGDVPCEAVLARTRPATVEGIRMPLVAPEDIILIKLVVIKSYRPWDWFDALSVLEGSRGQLDWDYMIERSSSSPERLLSLLLFARTAGHGDLVPGEVLSGLAELTGL